MKNFCLNLFSQTSIKFNDDSKAQKNVYAVLLVSYRKNGKLTTEKNTLIIDQNMIMKSEICRII